MSDQIDWLEVGTNLFEALDLISKSPTIAKGLGLQTHRDPVQRALKFKEDLKSIYHELESLVKNRNIPKGIRKYYEETFRNFLLESYVSSNITSTVAIEAALKERYRTNKFSPTYIKKAYGQPDVQKTPKTFEEYIEWGYQHKLIKVKRFADAMREVRNNVVHGEEEDYRDEAKQIIVTMTTILNRMYS